MKESRNMKFVQDVPTEGTTLKVRKPLKLRQEENRKFIRLVINSSMSVQKIKDQEGHYWPEGDWHIINGVILNISAGGVLVELDQEVNAGEVVSMQFSLQEVTGMENVLGLIKRVDAEPDCFIVGIEFITREKLVDYFSEAELELLSGNHKNFDESLRTVLDKYVYAESGPVSV